MSDTQFAGTIGVMIFCIDISLTCIIYGINTRLQDPQRTEPTEIIERIVEVTVESEPEFRLTDEEMELFMQKLAIRTR